MVACNGETNQMYERQMKYVAASVTHPGRDKEVEYITNIIKQKII